MKKNFPKILAGCTAMVLMTGALLVPSMAALVLGEITGISLPSVFAILVTPLRCS
mgnify:CR=1 FL=1